MEKKEEEYLAEKISLIRAVITGSLMGAYMFPPKDNDWGTPIQHQTDKAMELIERDIRNIYKHAKRKCKN